MEADLDRTGVLAHPGGVGRRIFMRAPGRSFPHCVVRESPRAPIDLERARVQHRAYAEALARLGAGVRVLEPLESHPDSVFVEDAALVLDECIVLCPSSVRSRQGEEDALARDLTGAAPLVRLEPPATLDGGDCLRTDRHVFVGLSARSNRAACEQLEPLAAPRRVEALVLGPDLLHLKCAVSYLGDDTLLVASHWIDPARFGPGYRILEVPADEGPAANCVRFSDTLLVADHYPGTAALLRDAGFSVELLDLSEFAKGDGSVSCLSLLL